MIYSREEGSDAGGLLDQINAIRVGAM